MLYNIQNSYISLDKIFKFDFHYSIVRNQIDLSITFDNGDKESFTIDLQEKADFLIAVLNNKGITSSKFDGVIEIIRAIENGEFDKFDKRVLNYRASIEEKTDERRNI